MDAHIDLSARKALITGGGSGLGRTLALDFARARADVHICGRRLDRLEEIAASSERITAHRLDVTHEDATEALFKEIGACDIVIANAGVAESAPLHRTSRELWERIISVNLTGCFLTLRAGLRALKASDADWGRLIAISSIAGLSGHRYAGAYAASKHGVNGLVRSMSAELARSGITANSLCPGYLDTEMTDRTVDAITEKTGKSRSDAREALDAMSQLGRLIEPREVSSLAIWLCGPDSAAVNGQTIAINGGER